MGVGAILHRWTGMDVRLVGMGMPTGTHLKMRKHDRTLNSRRKGVKCFHSFEIRKIGRNAQEQNGSRWRYATINLWIHPAIIILYYCVFYLFSFFMREHFAYVFCLITLPSYEYRLCDHKLCLFLSCVWAAIKRCITSMASVVCIQYTTGWPSKW